MWRMEGDTFSTIVILCLSLCGFPGDLSCGSTFEGVDGHIAWTVLRKTSIVRSTVSISTLDMA